MTNRAIVNLRHHHNGKFCSNAPWRAVFRYRGRVIKVEDRSLFVLMEGVRGDVLPAEPVFRYSHGVERLKAYVRGDAGCEDEAFCHIMATWLVTDGLSAGDVALLCGTSGKQVFKWLQFDLTKTEEYKRAHAAGLAYLSTQEVTPDGED